MAKTLENMDNKTAKNGTLVSVAKKTALLARVSTAEQKLDSQVDMLKLFAAQRGFAPVVVIQAKESGVKRHRETISKVMDMAKSGEIDKIVVEDCSRLGRDGCVQSGNLVRDLNRLGVTVITIKEGLTLDGGVMSEMFLAICSSFSRLDFELRRQKASRGVKAAQKKNGGVVPWNRKGKGRTVDTKKRSAIVKLVRAGSTYSEVTSLLGVSPTTISRAVKEAV